LLQHLVVLLGLACWECLRVFYDTYPVGISAFVPCLVSVLMFGCAARKMLAKECSRDRTSAAVCSGLAFYALAILLMDPYSGRLGVMSFALVRVALTLAPLFGVSCLVRSGSRLAVCAVVLLSVLQVASLVSNGEFDFGGGCRGTFSY
jgi:hypothetical protein